MIQAWLPERQRRQSSLAVSIMLSPRDRADIRAGFAGAVPAGVEIGADPGWPEAVILRGPQPSDKPSVPGGAANPL